MIYIMYVLVLISQNDLKSFYNFLIFYSLLNDGCEDYVMNLIVINIINRKVEYKFVYIFIIVIL